MSIESLLASVLEQSTPLVLAALAAMITLRANILNVAVEGMMLVAAFSAIAVGALTDSAFIGFWAGLAGAIFALYDDFLTYLHFPLNPSGSVYDPCIEEGSCGYDTVPF